jgi:ketol-acid reductoisomerase
MRSIINILENDAAVTGLLNNGSESVFAEFASQAERIPHIVVELMEEEEMNTMSTTVSTEARCRVFSVSDRLYTDDGVSGAYDMGVLVKADLVGQSGTFNNETIKQVNLESTSHFIESPERVVVEQIFQVFKTV